MPRVPVVTGPSVAEQGIPSAYQQAPQGLGGAGAVQAGYLQQGAQVAMGLADQMRRQVEEFDQVRVDDALNKLKERQLDLTFGDTGFTRQRGLAALQRESGKPLAVEYGDELTKSATELADGLGNDRQKRLFKLRANDIATGFRGSVMAHEGQQADAYMLSVREGTIANRQNEIGLFWNDPVKIDDALLSIEGAVADMGRKLGGKSAEWIQARSLSETSKALVGAVAGALDRNDYASADALLKRYSEKMTADDLVKTRKAVDQQIDAGVALTVAGQVMRQMAPKIQPTDFDRVVGITIQTESGGNPNAVSPKGAKGLMQVMDATNRDPGFGVRPARDDSPAERVRVGRDYLAAMVKRYEGDLGRAWAAYNAGPGAVDEALTRAAARPGGDWLTFLPKETQDYVRKNLAAYEAGDGRPQAPTLQDVHAAVRQRVGEADPRRLKMALDEATRQFDDLQKANKQREDEAVANAQRWLASNGGRFGAMPATLRAAVPPGQLDNLMQFGDRIQKGDDKTDPEVYFRLSKPEVLRSLSDDEFLIVTQRGLSEQDAKHFVQQRANLLAGKEGDKPGDLNGTAVRGVVDSRLRELGIDPSPKDKSTEAMQVGALRQYVDRSLLAAQQAAGKKFNDAEVQKHVDGLFAQTDVVKGWFSDSSKPMLAMGLKDIPRDVRDRLRADFKAAGIDEPTDGQMLGAYWQAKSSAARRKITPLPRGTVQ